MNVARFLGRHMADYIPQVNEEDCRRIIERDFPIEQRERVYELLKSHTAKHWTDTGKYRIYLSILKLADGSLTEVTLRIAIGETDFRDVVGPAEYPRFWRIGFVGAEKLSDEQRKQLIEDDWQEYQQWLHKK
jgi:hypothetical protein